MPDALAPYWAVVSARLRVLLQYRVAAFAGFITQVFWGGVKLMVLGAFYAQASGPQPLSLQQAIAYVWLGQALLGLLPWSLEPELEEKVKSGAVAYELLRPVELYGLWYARVLGFRVATAALRCPLMLTFALICPPLLGLPQWALPWPASFASAGAFLLSLAAMVALSSSVNMLLHAVLLLTVDGRGLNTIIVGLIILFSGMTVPLPLCPDWLQPFLRLQPLSGLMDVPLRIYSGHIVPREALFEIGRQVLWTVALVALGRAALRRASVALVVQGG